MTSNRVDSDVVEIGSTPEQRGGGGHPGLGAGIHTFLIADIRGYTQFTHERGDDAAAALASAFAALTDEVISGHDGVVLELRGDEALAVFSSARQAIRAAVQLQARLRDPDQEGFPLPVGVGLDAGEAVPVLGGFRGASLNVAARLCSLAGPGEVLATPEVVHLATRMDGVRFRPRGRVELKGIARPVDVVMIELEAAATDPSPALRSASVRRVFAGARQTLSRHRTAGIVAALGTILVLTPALVRPLFTADDPAAAGSQSKTGHLQEPLVATVVHDGNFHPTEPQVYMVPDGGAAPQNLPKDLTYFYPSSTRYARWFQEHGGVALDSQAVRLVLTGRGRSPVVITQITPIVLKRNPPLHGWWIKPELGGQIKLHLVQANLNCSPPTSLFVTNHHASPDMQLTVNRSDVEELEVDVFATQTYVRWALDINYVSNGKVGVLHVLDPNFAVTGEALHGNLRSYFEFTADPGRPQRDRHDLRRTPQYDTTHRDVAFLTRISARRVPCTPH